LALPDDLLGLAGSLLHLVVVRGSGCLLLRCQVLLLLLLLGSDLDVDELLHIAHVWCVLSTLGCGWCPWVHIRALILRWHVHTRLLVHGGDEHLLLSSAWLLLPTYHVLRCALVVQKVGHPVHVARLVFVRIWVHLM